MENRNQFCNTCVTYSVPPNLIYRINADIIRLKQYSKWT